MEQKKHCVKKRSIAVDEDVQMAEKKLDLTNPRQVWARILFARGSG